MKSSGLVEVVSQVRDADANEEEKFSKVLKLVWAFLKPFQMVYPSKTRKLPPTTDEVFASVACLLLMAITYARFCLPFGLTWLQQVIVFTMVVAYFVSAKSESSFDDLVFVPAASSGILVGLLIPLVNNLDMVFSLPIIIESLRVIISNPSDLALSKEYIIFLLVLKGTYQ